MIKSKKKCSVGAHSSFEKGPRGGDEWRGIGSKVSRGKKKKRKERVKEEQSETHHTTPLETDGGSCARTMIFCTHPLLQPLARSFEGLFCLQLMPRHLRSATKIGFVKKPKSYRAFGKMVKFPKVGTNMERVPQEP